jgi:hypothetical protein
MVTRVRNLETSEVFVYTLPPREAVMCAYAASRNDYNTWQYEERYGHLVTVGKSGKTVHCGTCSAKL